LNCGARIQEVNAIRKHVSGIKGGRLAELAYPSTVLSLILSDVIDDSMDNIGSGPTPPHSSSFPACLSMIDRSGVGDIVPLAVPSFLKKGAAGEIADPPKADNPIFQQVQNLHIGNNQLALVAAKEKAQALGYNTLILSSSVEGEARRVAIDHVVSARD